jgi:hypothetical protein
MKPDGRATLSFVFTQRYTREARQRVERVTVLSLEKRQQLGQVTNFEVGRWHIAAAWPSIAIDPRHAQTRGLRPLDVIHVAVADVEDLVRLDPEAVERALEHEPIGLVGSDFFGNEDEFDRQCEDPGGEMLVVGVGNDGGASMPE